MAFKRGGRGTGSLWRWILSAGLVAALGCFGALRPPSVPMATTSLAEGTDSSCLVVLLPGRADRPVAFSREGFAEGGVWGCEVMAVDAHLGYYRSRTVVDRLRQDVVLPARARGFEDVWLAGVSLGGLGSLLYAKNHPQDLAGVFAIAPFLGEAKLLDEIRSQGGVKAWSPTVTSGDESLEGLWAWLQEVSEGSPAPPLFLAFGADDAFADGGELLAEILPADQTLRVAGGHDWATWRLLWRRFLSLAGARSIP
ncbi:MAG: alpha/beta hydrolase [Acidobacteriota bacterium]